MAKKNYTIKHTGEKPNPKETIERLRIVAQNVDGYPIYSNGGWYVYDEANNRLVGFEVMGRNIDAAQAYKDIVAQYKFLYLGP